MEWSSSQRFTLNRTSVLRHAPEQSGVYGLYVFDQMVLDEKMGHEDPPHRLMIFPRPRTAQLRVFGKLLR